MKFRMFNIWCFAFPAIAMTLWSACAQPEDEGPHPVSMSSAKNFFESAVFISDRTVRANAVVLDNEIGQCDVEEAGTNFYCNPLLLNNKPLEFADFSIKSKGILSLVKGDPESSEAVKIPFRICLRRDGEIITAGKSDINSEVTEVEISDVLSHAKLEDHLLIIPVRKSDYKAKRIIRILDGC